MDVQAHSAVQSSNTTPSTQSNGITENSSSVQIVSSSKKPKNIIFNDFILISIMAVLAACGLIYEYLLSHYAGRILGSMETAIYSIIGLMIVSMGCGSFYARRFKDSFLSFAWLEVSVALLGSTVILLIAALIGLSHELPKQLAQHYGIASYILMSEGLTGFLVKFSMALPYIFAFLLGFLIGMEIPLMARIREQYYGESLTHNAGTIYGADYIGAGAGAALWVLLMLKLEINQAAALTASINLIAGLIFIIRFRSYIQSIKWLLLAHSLLAFCIVAVFAFGGHWQKRMQDMLYIEEVVFQTHTQHQNIVFTQHDMPAGQPDIIDFYINGSLQFSSMEFPQTSKAAGEIFGLPSSQSFSSIFEQLASIEPIQGAVSQ